MTPAVEPDLKLKFLSSLRTKLLDLSLRNNLLNFHEKSGKVVKIIDELPNHIHSFMVEKQNSMVLLPLTDLVEDNSQLSLFKENADRISVIIDQNQPTSSTKNQLQQAVQSVESAISDDEEEASAIERDDTQEIPEVIGFDRKNSPHLYDEFLQTNLVEDRLDGRMRRLHSDYRNILDSTGSNMLFLSVGFLEWHDPTREPEKMRLAPLILIPVHLSRGLTSVANQNGHIYRYSVRYTGDDISTNLTLALKLRCDFNLALPEFGKNGLESPEEYLQQVSNMLRSWNPPTGEPWRVVRYIRLGFFTFSKDVIYRDLDPTNWPKSNLINNFMVSTLLAGRIPDEPWEVPLAEVEENQRSCKIPTVMDADSSQIKVLIAASKGKNIIVQGPPGTGKSQTITNLIAAALSEGKTVLFMAEKLPALEVVRSRLTKVELGPYCLELHSKCSNVNSVHEQIRSRIYLKSPDIIEKTLLNSVDKINNFRKDLNCHCELMSTILPEANCDLASLFWKYEAAKLKLLTSIGYNPTDISKQKIEIPVLIINRFYSSETYLPTVKDLESIKNVLQIIAMHNIEDIPRKGIVWEGFRPENLTQDKVDQIGSILQETIDALEAIKLAQTNLNIPVLSDCDLITISRIYSICNNLKPPPNEFNQDLVTDLVKNKATINDFRMYAENIDYFNRVAGNIEEKIAKNTDFFDSTLNQALEAIDYLIMLPGNSGECWNEVHKNITDLGECQFRLTLLISSGKELLKHFLLPTQCNDLTEISNLSELIDKLIATDPEVANALTTFPFNCNIRKYIQIATDENERICNIKDKLIKLFDLQNAPSSKDISLLRADIREGRKTWKEWFPFGKFANAKKKLKRFKKGNSKITDDSFLSALEDLEKFPDEEINFKNDPTLKRNIGPLFLGTRTNWSILKSALDSFTDLQNFLQDIDMTSAIALRLPELLQTCDIVRNHIKNIRQSLSGLIDLLPNLKLMSKEILSKQNLSTLLEITKQHLKELSQRIEIIQLFKCGAQTPFIELKSDIKNAIVYRAKEKMISDFKNRNLAFFNSGNGLLNANSKALLATIEWIEEIQDKTKGL